MKTVIIEYGSGNANSLKNAFNRLGEASIYTSNSKDIEAADRIILPGIGHHGSTIQSLKNSRLFDTLNYQVTVLHKPILGICLGMQLMTNYSEEGHSKGFGWINSTTKKIVPNNTKTFKVPHVGWNLIRCSGNSDLLSGIPLDQEPFYFCNSYAIDSVQSQVNFSTYEYDKNYVAHFEDNNIFGVQFHPEKSHSWGNILLQNFLKLSN